MDGAGSQSATPCYKKKKKKDDDDFLAGARDHFEQFKNTTAERHWICLKNTVRRAKNTTPFSTFFGSSLSSSSKVGGESDTSANDAAADSHGDPISVGFD